jgi:L,D-transpeptidase catalytic domain
MKKIVTTGMALSLVIVAHTCKRTREGDDSTSHRQDLAPVIEIERLEQGRGQWKIAAANAVIVTVMAPGAEGVQILGRLEGVEEDYLKLRTLTAPVDRASGKFVTQLTLAPDFAGQVWAEASYPDGAKNRTETIALAVSTGGAGTAARLDAVGGSVGTDESARSDKLTGGRIRKTRLIAGESDIRITVNAPAFLLTLWQNGKEVRAYNVGIGHKNFPLPVSEREATVIIFNPHWVPSDGVWAPNEKFKPNDPRRPLSRIKIPLGSGYMIHDATNVDDIGRAVSRGGVLMLEADLLDLAEKIITARNPPPTNSRIAQSGDGHERLAAPLDPPLLVDINYDLQVVEGGALHLYPDVYERGAFALDSLRAELQSAGVASPMLEDQALRRILNNVSADTQFVVDVADIGKGRSWRGRKLPLRKLPLIYKPIGKSGDVAVARGDIRRGAPRSSASSARRRSSRFSKGLVRY